MTQQIVNGHPSSHPFEMRVAWREGDPDISIGIGTTGSRTLIEQTTAAPAERAEIARRTRLLAAELSLPDDSGAVLDISDDALYQAVINIVQGSGIKPNTSDEVFPHDGAELNGIGFDSVWTQLDRTGVNRAIKLLRRARDAAFGADA